jgi:nucleotide-binding universal stress UspA family protein
MQPGNFERIMLATDGSEYSEGAVRVAIEMSRRHNAKLLILSIAIYSPEYASLVPDLEEIATEKAQAIVKKTVEQAQGTNYEVVVKLANDPYRGIVEAAEEQRADIIVMGRRGRRGLARLMVGDATAKVVGGAPCAVLVVPKSANIWDKRILVATDGSRYGDAATLLAAAVAKGKGYPLTAVSAVVSSHSAERRSEAEAAVQRVKDGLAGSGIEVSGIVEEGRPEQVIIGKARETGADLIVMGTHGRTGMDRILLGSVSERVIGQAECPVLLVKAA